MARVATPMETGNKYQYSNDIAPAIPRTYRPRVGRSTAAEPRR
jgi:hypothetical protein